jgi:hypothetical protein
MFRRVLCWLGYHQTELKSRGDGEVVWLSDLEALLTDEEGKR